MREKTKGSTEKPNMITSAQRELVKVDSNLLHKNINGARH